MGKVYQIKEGKAKETVEKVTPMARFSKAAMEETIKTRFLHNLEKYGGNIAAAIDELGYTRSKVTRWLREDPVFREKFYEVKETLKDIAEEKLFEHVRRGDLPAVMFFLKTQAKDRGYTERQEVSLEATLNKKIILQLPEGQDFPLLKKYGQETNIDIIDVEDSGSDTNGSG